MAVQKCPVCSGNGMVQSSFYSDIEQGLTGTPVWVQCRACAGQGVFHDPPPPVRADQDFPKRFFPNGTIGSGNTSLP